MNTWRFSLRAKLMKWTELRGAASSMLHASRQPPKCISRSRGAADDAEKAWCSKEAAHQRTRSPGALDVEGDFDATSCRENVIRWKKCLFWRSPIRCGAVFCNVREPLRQFHKFLMEVPRVSCKVAKLARLVWCKASTASEFDVLINTDAWCAQVRVLPTPGSCCIVWLLLSNTAYFDRRVVQMTRAFPMRLLWLAKAPTSRPCLQRRQVADDELTNTSPDSLEDSALKTRILFHDQLSRPSRLDVPAWNCLRCSSKSRATCMLTPGKSKQ